MSLVFRKATMNDCELVYNWANDKTVRENSFNTSQIKFEEHVNWFRDKVNSPYSFLFICYDGQNPIGQIRIDVENNIGIINYMVDKKYRGMGYGTEILNEVISTVRKEEIKVSKLIGKTKIDNVASQKAFEKAGYIQKQFKDYIEYHMLLDA